MSKHGPDMAVCGSDKLAVSSQESAAVCHQRSDAVTLEPLMQYHT